MFYSILYVLPKNFISYVFGVIAQISWPHFLVYFVIKGFSKIYKIDVYEAEKELHNYKSLNEFFTRKLKKGMRPVDKGIVHPADAALTESGQISDGTLVQAKGMTYTISDFLGQSYSQKLLDGYFLTYYLCPTDYHRVHSPVEGQVVSVEYIPGKLWPVNKWSVQNISKLFSINERVVVNIETSSGLCSLVMVGATNVGKMTVDFDQGICTNSFLNRKSKFKKYTTPIKINTGDELGIFHMGSTVIMIYEKTFFDDKAQFLSGKVRVGESLGSVCLI